MKNRTLAFRVIIGLCLALTLFYSDAFARDGGRDGGHYYRDGTWYRHGLLGFDIAVSALAIGALVDSLPPRHTTVIVGGVPYYYYDNYYYRPYPGGYVVVPPPLVTQPIVTVPPPPPPVVMTAPMPSAQYQVQSQDMVTINIPNSSGGYTAVTLKKSGNGFVGPQGEYYSENPTVLQLKTLYGK
ncbi:MAG: hypothetical protein NTY76_06250 [Candidatus Omnitrophica bacterium]|nr:hypothetical protein [Candidatus Omnitrophota bacterium]